MREARVEQFLKQKVEKDLAGKCRKWVCPGYRGAPDRIVLLPGKRIFFVELKRPKGGRLSTQQKRFHEMLQSFGFTVLVLNTREKILTFIASIKHAPVTGYGASLGGML